MRTSKYLSYSQYNAYFTKQFVKRYLDGVKLDTPYVNFGKEIANRFEAGETFGIEVPEEREKFLKCQFGDVPLLGFLDGFSKYVIHEYKATKNVWSQATVDRAEQLTFYAILVSENYNIPIDQIKIKFWCLETEMKNGEIKLTGNVDKKETRRTNKDKLTIYPKMKEAWEGIGELCYNYFNKPL